MSSCSPSTDVDKVGSFRPIVIDLPRGASDVVQRHEALPSVMSEKRFVIADYQRPYAWEDKQLGDLWDDLDLLGTGHHYAGTLVLRRTEDPPEVTASGEELATHEVVDGQQRLTTCLLLLDRLRRKLVTVGGAGDEGVAEAIVQLGQLSMVKIDNVKRPRLELGQELNPFWVDSILGDQPLAGASLIAPQRRLAHASQFFDARLESLVEGASAEVSVARLLDLRRRITSGLRFLVYEVGSTAEVGVIFETLNERGRPLSELEKIKNYLLYLARQINDARSEELAELVNTSWAKIFTNLADLPRRMEDELLRGHWLATKKPVPREWKRTVSVKERFPRTDYVPGSLRLRSIGESSAASSETAEDHWQRLYDDVEDYVRSLHLCSVFVRDMHNAAATYPDFTSGVRRVRKVSGALVRSGVEAIFRPLLFACRLRYPADGELYADVLDMCERYSARVFAICQRRANAGETFLARAGHDLYLDRYSDPRDVLADIRSELWRFASDEMVRANFVPETNWYARRAHKYVLYEYEIELARNPGDLKPFRDYVDTGNRKTTEHILPQNPEEDSEWWNHFDEVTHAQLVNGLGNLVLTYDNSVYGRKPYNQKRGQRGQETPCYYTASLARERQVAEKYEDWRPESILDRLTKIEEWAMRRWHVSAPTLAAVRELDEVLDDSSEDTGDLTSEGDSDPALDDTAIGA